MKMQYFLLLLLSTLVLKGATQGLKTIKNRIIGGVRTSIDEIGGYLTALRYNGAFICGSSLITERIVITAAHCVVAYVRNFTGLTIEGGITQLSEPTKRVHILNFMIPKSYNKIEADKDIAVIKLKEPLQGPKIRTIKLCTHELEARQKVRVSGWGLQHQLDNDPSNTVRSVIVPIVSHSKCQRIYKDVTELTKHMMCAGVRHKRDACHMDSGGPLVYKDELCGVVSFGVGCGEEYPGVYTNVKVMVPWIEKAIEKLNNVTEKVTEKIDS